MAEPLDESQRASLTEIVDAIHAMENMPPKTENR
jgi:hypothetical protein